MANGESDWQIDLARRQEIIRKHPSFSGLTNEESEILASLLREQEFPAGKIIVREGDPIDSVYFIIKGSVDVRHVTIKEGVPHIQSVATLKAGDTIGLNDTGFYSVTGRRTATVVASEETLLLRLGLAVFHGFALVHPHVNQVMREYARRMLNMNFNV